MQNRPTVSGFGPIFHCIHGLGLRMAVSVMLVHLAAASASAQGSTGARPRSERPDFSGVWLRLGTPRQISNSDMFHPDEPPLTPWAQEQFRIVRKGIANPLQQAREDIDPILEPYCMIPGYPRILLRPGAMQIVQTPTALYMLFDNYSQSRTIYLDGRPHAENTPPTFMGHAIGRWDGDTIVAETVGLNDLTWLDGIGTPHSADLRIVERIRMIDPNTMRMEFQFDDPKAFTRPWNGEKNFERRPDWELMEYVICENSTGDEWWKALEREGARRDP
jgi:hypothetical protein